VVGRGVVEGRGGEIGLGHGERWCALSVCLWYKGEESMGFDLEEINNYIDLDIDVSVSVLVFCYKPPRRSQPHTFGLFPQHNLHPRNSEFPSKWRHSARGSATRVGSKSRPIDPSR
jgi:hypothetical protein